MRVYGSMVWGKRVNVLLLFSIIKETKRKEKKEKSIFHFVYTYTSVCESELEKCQIYSHCYFMSGTWPCNTLIQTIFKYTRIFSARVLDTTFRWINTLLAKHCVCFQATWKKRKRKRNKKTKKCFSTNIPNKKSEFQLENICRVRVIVCF